MDDLRRQRGMAGENLAAKYLEGRGLKILARERASAALAFVRRGRWTRVPAW